MVPKCSQNGPKSVQNGPKMVRKVPLANGDRRLICRLAFFQISSKKNIEGKKTHLLRKKTNNTKKNISPNPVSGAV